jgi:TRAP transporter TAXI family solute receptor
MPRLLTLCLMLCVGIIAEVKAETYSIATGSPSGLYYPFGGGLAALWSDKSDHINMKAEVTSASVTNLIQVHKGESKLGITQGDALRDAIAGKGRFPEPMNVAVLFALYPNVVHVIVAADSDIMQIEDLRGKRVSVGATGSGNMVTTRNVLNGLGIAFSDFTPYYLSYTETANALRDGTIDVGFIVGGTGVAVMAELALTRDIRLLSFSNAEMQTLSSLYPAYTTFAIPEGIYKGVDTPTHTVSLWNFLVAQRDAEDEFVQEILEITFSNPDYVRDIAFSARYTTPENTLAYSGNMLHSAAHRYFSQYK